MKVEDYEIVEHEMMHVEDYFSNHKIAFTEKMSKLHFLQNLRNTSSKDKIYECVDKSKKQLVEIKKKGVENKNTIENLSKEIFDLETALEEDSKSLENEEAEYKALEEELRTLEGTLNNYEEFAEINRKYEQLCKDVKVKSDQIANVEKDIADIRAIDLEREYLGLKEEKSKLEAKQKRLSVIQYEKFIEDLYFHYETFKNFYQKIFNMEISSTAFENKIIIKCKSEEIDVEIVIKDGSLEDVKILKYNRKHKLNFDEVVSHYKRINDPRYLICFLVFQNNV
ncbi:hypothetical protein NGRA_2126 [Nosema granulosis]|uniref:Uncharacterized protein n=1 Tax=Nosema granulosis TaxID=83296 RepID=A0A9P6GYQ2_9MICR|nr:hypothetical protein NGRA_2126 [Nosema granulosis]